MPAKTKKGVNTPTSSRPIPADKNSSQSHSKPVTSQPGTSKSQTGPGGQGILGGQSTDGVEPAAKSSDNSSTQPTVNRKKQKRREAAKKAAEQRAESEPLAPNGYTPGVRGPTGYFREETEETGDFHHRYGDDAADIDDTFFSGAEDSGYGKDDVLRSRFEQMGQVVNGVAVKRKKDTQKVGPTPAMANNPAGNSASMLRITTPLARSHLPSTPTLSAAALRSAHQNFSHDQIWNTSTQAERENIKQFWLELGEEERRSLVKVEKEAVLRKMKEQQKHSCSCTVCGRKRTAIEEELEVLYDAYYEELEQFANHDNDMSNGAAIMSDPRAYSHLRTQRHPMAGQYPLERTEHDLIEDDEGLDEEDYDDDEEAYSDDDVEQIPRPPSDFFTFGNSLTVKDGILTVADDLLKNDGKYFIDMMESLAEKRMQREEAFHFPSAALAHQNSHQGHNHPAPDEDDDYDDEEDEEDYESQDEDELEADEMDAMTEEQRMEEGRRMFQIFAARMFEQRVLTAYREMVARERQKKLLKELEEETRLATEHEAKRAKDAAKKNEKKKKKKQEEKAKKEAEKAAQEAAARALEQQKLEEQRQKKEEQRKKREAEKKAAEEDRLRKEAEKQRKIQEERKRQERQELDRKQRAAKEKERRREEAQRERELKEARDQEAKDQEARGRKTEEERQRKEQVKESRDRTKQEDQTRLNAKRPVVAVPQGIHLAYPSTLQSPQFQVATPLVPAKAPIPARPRQQGPPSHGSSPHSQKATTADTTQSSTPSSTNTAIPNSAASTNTSVNQQVQGLPLHHPQPSAPISPFSTQTRSSQPQHVYSGMSAPSVNGTAPSGLGMVPSMVPQIPIYHGPPIGGPQRGYCPPNGISFPPGMNGNSQFTQGPGTHFQAQAAMTAATPLAQKQPTKSQLHSRQPSGMADLANQPTPISRPPQTGASSASTPDKKENRKVYEPEVEQLATQLGSKALLDDSDIPLSSISSDHTSAPGAPGSGRAPFNNFHEPKNDAFQPGNWGAFSPTGGFAAPPSWGPPGLTPKQGAGWPTHHQPGTNAFGIIGGGVHASHRPHASRPVAIRLMVSEACKKLSATPGTSNDGFHPAQFLLRQLELMKPPHEPTISLNEMLEICDTEGNAQNGGGNFVLRKDNFQGQSVKFEPGDGSGNKRSVGDIGSPKVAHSQLATFGGIGQPVSGPKEGP